MHTSVDRSTKSLQIDRQLKFVYQALLCCLLVFIHLERRGPKFVRISSLEFAHSYVFGSYSSKTLKPPESDFRFARMLRVSQSKTVSLSWFGECIS